MLEYQAGEPKNWNFMLFKVIKITNALDFEVQILKVKGFNMGKTVIESIVQCNAEKLIFLHVASQFTSNSYNMDTTIRVFN